MHVAIHIVPLLSKMLFTDYISKANQYRSKPGTPEYTNNTGQLAIKVSFANVIRTLNYTIYNYRAIAKQEAKL